MEKERLNAERIQDLCATTWLGKEICYYDSIDSTNAQARRLSEEGAAHGTVIVSDIQTGGKGRRGRTWVSPGGSGIWFSLLLYPDIPVERAHLLTLVAAMAVVKAIREKTALEPRIKWPNDVILSGKKTCGILTEMIPRVDGKNRVIVGIGINTHTRAFDPEIADTATSLVLEGAKEVDRAELLAVVLEQFEKYYDKYGKTLDVSIFREEYESFLVNKDQSVRVEDPGGAYRGIARGINEDGELLVECEQGLVAVNAGEVSVRGIYGYV